MKRLLPLLGLLAFATVLFAQSSIFNNPAPNNQFFGALDNNGTARPMIGMNTSGVIQLDPDDRNVRLGNNLTVDGTSTLTGNTAVTGNLAVTGTSTFGGVVLAPGHITVSFNQGGTVADALDTLVWIADRAYILTSVNAAWATAESTGAMDIDPEKLTGTQACASGTDLLTVPIDATGTAATTTAGTLSATAADYTFAAGNRLCVDLSATPNEVVNIVVTFAFNPI